MVLYYQNVSSTNPFFILLLRTISSPWMLINKRNCFAQPYRSTEHWIDDWNDECVQLKCARFISPKSSSFQKGKRFRRSKYAISTDDHYRLLDKSTGLAFFVESHFVLEYPVPIINACNVVHKWHPFHQFQKGNISDQLLWSGLCKELWCVSCLRIKSYLKAITSACKGKTAFFQCSASGKRGKSEMLLKCQLAHPSISLLFFYFNRQRRSAVKRVTSWEVVTTNTPKSKKSD